MSSNISVPRRSSASQGHAHESVPRSDSFSPAPAGHPRSLLRKRFEQRQIQTLAKIEGDDLSKVLEAVANNSTLDKQKFQEVMIKAGHHIYKDNAVVDALWNALDVNGDKQIDSKEVLLGLATLTSGELEPKLKFGFKLFDLNGDGFISRDELANMLSRIARIKYTKNEELDEFVSDFVNSTFAKFDANGDGKLNLDEFSTAGKENDAIRAFFTLSVSNLA